jgi:hypothetical protein
VLVCSEDFTQSLGLPVGEQVGADVQGPSRGVEWVVRVARMSMDDLPDPAAALVDRISGQSYYMEKDPAPARNPAADNNRG